MCVLALGLHALAAYGQVFRVNGTGAGDYTTRSLTPVWVLGEHPIVPVGERARVDVSGSFNWYFVPGSYCDGYVSLVIDGVDYSYVGFTSTPESGTNDKPFHLFGYKNGDGLEHRFQLKFRAGTPGCEVGIENTGTTNLVMTVVLESQ